MQFIGKYRTFNNERSPESEEVLIKKAKTYQKATIVKKKKANSTRRNAIRLLKRRLRSRKLHKRLGRHTVHILPIIEETAENNNNNNRNNNRNNK